MEVNTQGATFSGYFIAPGLGHTCGIKRNSALWCGGDQNGMGSPPAGRYLLVGAGRNHSCAISVENGILACWGDNQYGQASPPTGQYFSLDSTRDYNCAINSDGALRCWGNANPPGNPPGGAFFQVGVGASHACALRASDSQIVCWGDPTAGKTSPPAGAFTQIGAGLQHSCGLKSDGAIACWGGTQGGARNAPAGVFKQIGIGGQGGCAVRSDGTPACWGFNANAQLLNPPAGAKFVQINVGDEHICGLQENGRFVCWGDNAQGQLQVPAEPLFEPVRVSAGYVHTCGLKYDNTAICWGDDTYGQAKPPTGLFRQVSAGLYHTCGLRPDGALACWGNNAYGQAKPPTGAFTQISTGFTHSCGIRADGTLACWGGNFYGQIRPPTGAFRQISAGNYHNCALRTDNTLACWGRNTAGEASPPTGPFLQVSAGAFHTCAIRTDNTLACWGSNSDGQARPPAGGFLQVSAGEYHTCGLRPHGLVECWGRQAYGALNAPNPWDRGSIFTQLDTGAYHACATSLDGIILCWGDNSRRQSGTVLDVTLRGAGVISDGWPLPVGIWCGIGLDCKGNYAPFPTPQKVTLAAKTADKFTFAGWGGACSGTAATCTVTMDAAKSVTATFMPLELKVSKAGSGGGLVSSAPAGIQCGVDCEESYKLNTVVTLTAAPYAGSTFAGWSGACSGAAATCTVKMDAAKTVTARFDTTTPGQTALTLYKADLGLGTVTSVPAGLNCGTTCTTGVAQFATGATVTLTATATPGFTFTGWSGCATKPTPQTCTVTLDTGTVVTATFSRPVLTVRKVGSGRIVTPPSTTHAGIFCGTDCTEAYNLNTPVTLIAIPDPSFRFNGWSGCRADPDSPRMCTVLMNQSRTVTAHFIP